MPEPGAGAGGARSGDTPGCTAAFSPSVQKVPVCALELLATQRAVQKNIVHVFAIWGLSWCTFWISAKGQLKFPLNPTDKSNPKGNQVRHERWMLHVAVRVRMDLFWSILPIISVQNSPCPWFKGELWMSTSKL